jgi:5'-nucleotidase
MRGRHLVNRAVAGAALVAAAVATGATGAAPAGAARKPAPITVLVTNDDGVSAPGIDAVVEALRAQKRTKVVVVAPAANNSGSGEKYTPGGAAGGPGTTASGYAATAVQGFPADAVDYALDVVEVEPDVVISGANHGQNMGTIVEISGTVGAARQAARRGIPALAVSAQLGDDPSFAEAGELAVAWLKERRAALVKRKASTTPLATIDSINVPSCPGGVRDLAETTLAPEGTTENLLSTTPDCASTVSTFTSDAQAFNNGYASLVEVPVAPTRP